MMRDVNNKETQQWWNELHITERNWLIKKIHIIEQQRSMRGTVEYLDKKIDEFRAFHGS